MPVLSDGNFTVATLHGPARRSFPFPTEHTTTLIEQDFMQFFADWMPLALSTPHATVATHFLVAESALQDVGNGVARWTRTYAPVPPTWDDYESFAYLFPGYEYSGNYPNYTAGRWPLPLTVASRLRHEYYQIGVSGGFSTPDDIPQISAQTYVGLYGGDITSESFFLRTTATTPSRETYQGWVSSQTWIVAEEGIIRPWMGNIYERVTRYVRAH